MECGRMESGIMENVKVGTFEFKISLYDWSIQCAHCIHIIHTRLKTEGLYVVLVCSNAVMNNLNYIVTHCHVTHTTNQIDIRQHGRPNYVASYVVEHLTRTLLYRVGQEVQRERM